MNENHIRRERLRKAERKRAIEEMRAALPVHNMEEIRQYRMPFHQAVIRNLQDRGYIWTSQFIEQVIKVQEDLREEAGPLSQVWARPQLIACKPEMTELCERLVKCENYNNSGNYDKECEELLRTAVRFAFSNEYWWWLGEQLLIQCLLTSSEHTFPDKKYQALSRYTYGKFLIEIFKEYEQAMEHLRIARQLSSGKDWMTKIVFPLDSDVLYIKINYLLYICLIRQVEGLMETDYIKAGRLAVIAKKLAAEACYIEGEITALMLKGMCELSCNDTKSAILTFSKAYYTQAKIGSKKGICETKIHMARAYLLNGNTELSLNTLIMLKESAYEFNLPYYLAQSYRHLGEYFLENGEANKATPLLVESLKIFMERSHVKESEQVRNLEAISVGLEHFSSYITLLSKTNKPEYLTKLINWKDSREPFAEGDNKSSLSAVSVDTIIENSIAELKETMIRKTQHSRREIDSIEVGTDVRRIVSINETPIVLNPEGSYVDDRLLSIADESFNMF